MGILQTVKPEMKCSIFHQGIEFVKVKKIFGQKEYNIFLKKKPDTSRYVNCILDGKCSTPVIKLGIFIKYAYTWVCISGTTAKSR